MFNPAADAGCKHCSFWADNFNGIVVHLRQREYLRRISRAPLAKIESFKKENGWSSSGSPHPKTISTTTTMCRLLQKRSRANRFHNYAIQRMNMSDREGSASSQRRGRSHPSHLLCLCTGIDMLNTAYHYLDLVPKGGRGDAPQSWVRYHDQ